jgi:predicted AlkP superfamily pyrophosphatase or phosphodiesterase
LLFTQILVSPRGDELTLDFAKTIVTHERLGQDEIVDYLGISFSGVDAVNHFFGPSSLENEDIILHLDRTLAALFAFIDQSVGLENVLIVLSADHGMAEIPEYMTESGFPAGRIYSEEVTAAANEAGQRLFGINDVALKFFRPYLYLDAAAIHRSDFEQEEVAHALARALMDVDGIALAQSRTGSSQSAEAKRIRRNEHPVRSGDIYVVQNPYWFLFDKGPIVAMHGSPWRYDTHVPIIFLGTGMTAAKVDRLVHPVDVAPTLSALLGMSGPAAAQGQPLIEVLR